MAIFIVESGMFLNLFLYLRNDMLLYLKVKPNQRFDKLEKTGSEWFLKLKAPAVDGKANGHLIEFLCEVLDLPTSKIILQKGQTTRFKCLEIAADELVVLSKLELICKNG